MTLTVEDPPPPPDAPNGTHDITCDVVVIGAGFTGMTAIDRFRRANMTVKCFEAGADFGGVWYWNRYPGARTDSEVPFYQLNIPEVWKSWNFTERFPDQYELREYIAHIDRTLDLRKDAYFNARVYDATWGQNDKKWTVKTQRGHVAKCRYLVLAVGILHRPYIPAFPGYDDYKGEVYHSAVWSDKFDPRGKRVAVIGTGATGLQLTQDLGKSADSLTVFIRRPNFCLPMRQRPLTVTEQDNFKSFYPTLLAAARDSVAGFPIPRQTCGVFDVSEEERLAHWNRTWEAGGFQFLLGLYNDVVLDPKANEAVYNFWAGKVRERLTDPKKQEIMAPKKIPYYFSTRIVPLESDYYDVLNQTNVNVHDLAATPIDSFTEKGIVTADGTLHEFDAIALGTGFDSSTGSLVNLGIKDKDGNDLRGLWEDGVSTYLGLTIPGFPNTFIPYGPHSPAGHTNATPLIESQVELVVEMIRKLDAEGATSIEAQADAAVEWKQGLQDTVGKTLRRFTDSWWNNSNVPGKKAEVITYMKGVNTYMAECRAALDGWKGFKVSA